VSLAGLSATTAVTAWGTGPKAATAAHSSVPGDTLRAPLLKRNSPLRQGGGTVSFSARFTRSTRIRLFQRFDWTTAGEFARNCRFCFLGRARPVDDRSLGTNPHALRGG